MSAAIASNYRHVDVAETAKIIRRVLKERYPKFKFKVRSSRYSGGASIDVLAPFKREDETETWDAINALLSGYQSRGFDGMIDMSFYKMSWLNPDGTAIIASHPGTVGSGGVYEAVDNPPPHTDSELVSFGSGYVSLSYDWRA